MPERLGLYRTALLDYRTAASCVAITEALATVSHDRLTGLLQGDLSGQRLLDLALRPLFVGERGYLIIDDTVIPQPFATAREGRAWVFSTHERKPVYGLCLVLLVWTDGTLRIPWGMRLWSQGCPSKYALALALLSYARHHLCRRPDFVLLDAWSPSRALLTRLRDDGWYFVCRLKKNRRCNGHTVRHHRRPPSGFLG